MIQLSLIIVIISLPARRKNRFALPNGKIGCFTAIDNQKDKDIYCYKQYSVHNSITN